MFSYLSTYFFRLETIIEKEAPAAPRQRVTEVPEGETSTEEDVMDDQVKDKGKGRDLENIGEGSESGVEDELKGEGGLKSQSDGEDEGEDEGGDDGEDEGGDDGEDEGEDEGEDDGENSGKEKDKDSDEDAGKGKGVGVDEDVEMVDITRLKLKLLLLEWQIPFK